MYAYAWYPTYCDKSTSKKNLCKISFLIAGADIITTNTYQASVQGFQKCFNLSYHESYKLIKNATLLAREAVSLENFNQPFQRQGK